MSKFDALYEPTEPSNKFDALYDSPPSKPSLLDRAKTAVGWDTGRNVTVQDGVMRDASEEIAAPKTKRNIRMENSIMRGYDGMQGSEQSPEVSALPSVQKVTRPALQFERQKDANRQWLDDRKPFVVDQLSRNNNLSPEDAEVEFSRMRAAGVIPKATETGLREATWSEAAGSSLDRVKPSFNRAMSGIASAMSDATGDYAMGQNAEALRMEANRELAAAQGRMGGTEEGTWKNTIGNVAPSLAQNLPGLLLTAATKNPVYANLGLAGMGASTFGDSYAEGNDLGLNGSNNAQQALLKAAAEVGPEKLSLNSMMRLFGKIPSPGDIKAGIAPLAKEFAKQQGVEHATEQMTTAMQAAVDKLYTNPDLTLGDWGKQVAETFRATAIQGPLLAGAGMATNVAANAARKAYDPLGYELQGYEQAVNNTNFAPLTGGVGRDTDVSNAARQSALNAWSQGFNARPAPRVPKTPEQILTDYINGTGDLSDEQSPADQILALEGNGNAAEVDATGNQGQRSDGTGSYGNLQPMPGLDGRGGLNAGTPVAGGGTNQSVGSPGGNNGAVGASVVDQSQLLNDVNGVTNAAVPEQVATQETQANDAQVGAEQAAAPLLTVPKQPTTTKPLDTLTQRMRDRTVPELLLISKTHRTADVRDAAQAEIKRRETEYAYSQNAISDDQKARQILDEKVDQDIAQAEAINNQPEVTNALQAALKRAGVQPSTAVEQSAPAPTAQAPARVANGAQFTKDGGLHILGDVAEIKSELASYGFRNVGIPYKGGLLVSKKLSKLVNDRLIQADDEAAAPKKVAAPIVEQKPVAEPVAKKEKPAAVNVEKVEKSEPVQVSESGSAYATHTKPAPYVAPLNKLVGYEAPDAAPSAETRKESNNIPTFQGGKTKMAVAITEKVKQHFSGTAEKIDTAIDYFGGSGSWGAYLSTVNFKNVKRLVIHEYNPDRLSKIKLFHNNGNEIARIAQTPEVVAYLEAVKQQIDTQGTYSGSALANVVAKREFRAKLREAAGNAIGKEKFEGFLQAIEDHGMASFGKYGDGQTANSAVDDIVRRVADNGKMSYEQMEKLRQRGVTVEYVTGDSYAAQQVQGNNVLAVVDPPYYATKGYNGVSLVPIETYNETRKLLERLVGAGNSIIYTDEAWWEKHDKNVGETKVPPDVGKVVDGLDAIGQLNKINASFGKFFRMPIATRMEVIGFYDGIKDARTVAAKSSAVNGQTSGQGVQRDAGVVGDGAGLRAGEGLAERDGRVSEGLPSGTSTGGIKYSKRSVLPETISIDGVDRSTRNSEGNQIADTEAGVRNFYAWFGDSKAVDAQGRPLVLYHGTASPDEINTFKAGASQYVYFSDLESVAATYADADADRRAEMGDDYKETIERVYLKIEQPFRFDAQEGDIDFADHADLFDDASADGLDGAIITSPVIGGDVTEGRFFIPFNADAQIKSATRNNGNFDGDINDTRFSKGATTSTPLPQQTAERLIARELGSTTLAKVLVDSGIVSFANSEAELKKLGGKLMVAWHGSPHDHDGFTTAKIGTGEGAQAYGWGLYFASSRAVAEWYKGNLSYKQIVKDFRDALPDDADFSDIIDLFNTGHFTPYQERVLKALSNDDWLGYDYPSQAITAAYRSLDDFDASQELKDAINSSGKLYQVELAPSEDEYLDWDKPLSKQSEKVKKLLAKVFGKYDTVKVGSMDTFWDADEVLGASMYREITGRFEKEARQRVRDGEYISDTNAWAKERASKLLNEIGIRGIRYLDGTSRGAGAGSSNYVIFSDEDVSITAKYAREQQILGATLPDGRIILNLGALTEQNFAGVFKHEGFHSTVRELVGEETWNQLMSQLEQNLKLAKGNDWVTRANSAIPADTKASDRTEEIGAYAIEQTTNGAKVPNFIKRWVDSLLSAIRTALIRGMGGEKAKLWAMKNLKPQDLANLAIAGLKAKARNELASQGRAAMAYSVKRESLLDMPAVKIAFNAAGTIQEAKLRAKIAYAKLQEETQKNGFAATTTDGKQVKFSGAGFKEVSQHAADRRALAILANAKALVESAMPLYSEAPSQKEQGVRMYHYYGVKADINGDESFALLEIKETTNGEWFYDADATDAETARAVYSAALADQTKSGAGVTEPTALKGRLAKWLAGVNGDPIVPKLSTGNNGDFDGSNPDIRYSTARNILGSQINGAWVSTEVTGFDNVVRQMQDKLVDTKRVVQAIKEQGSQVATQFDPYKQEILFHGRAAKRVHDFADGELRPLLQDMMRRNVEMAELENYLWARHAVERNAQIAKVNPNMPDGGSGLTNQQARDVMAGRSVTVGKREVKIDPAKMQHYAALAQRIDTISNETLNQLVAYGLETQETVDAWRNAYKYYVPLNRDLESDDNFLGAFNLGLGTGQGFSVRGSSSRRAQGSGREVTDILANLAMQRERAIVKGEKNRVSMAAYGLALKSPNPDFWLPINPDAKNRPLQDTIDELVRMGLSPMDAQSIAMEPKKRYVDPRTGMVTERINPALRNRADVLAVRVNGQDRFLLFSNDQRAQEMVRNLKNLDSDQLGRMLQTAASVTRWFASVNTQYNPAFGIVNGIRDAQSALLNLGTTPIAGKKAKVMQYGMSALAGIYQDLRAHRDGKAPSSPWALEFEEFAKEGGQTGYRDMFQTSKARTDALTDTLKELSAGKVVRWFKINESNPIFAWLSDYNTTIENAFRLAAYKVAKEQGISKAEAALIAKNLTVNFNKKGLAATQTGALYAFFNAAVQGTARIGETMLEHRGDQSKASNLRLSKLGKKIVLGGSVLGVMQAVMFALAGYDDDEPKQFQREKNIIIPDFVFGSDKYVSIPMPLGFHVIPGTTRIMTEFALSGGKDPGKRLTQLLGLYAEAFNPIGSAGVSLQTLAPTIADPLVALGTNRDWNGQKVFKEDFNKNHPTPGWTRKKDSATPWAQGMAYGINWISGGFGPYERGLMSPTPDQIDYLIGQVTGGTGREISKLAGSAKSLATGEDLPMYKVPLAGRFIGETKGVASETGRYYENLSKIGEHQDPIKRMKADNQTAMVDQYIKDHPESKLVKLADHTSQRVSEIDKQRRKLIEKDAPREEVKKLEERKRALMAHFNRMVEKEMQK